MRHDPFTGVFNGAYLNHQVRFNVQAAFLEEEISDDGLTRAFTHMSLRCNPGAPREVPRELRDALPPDPEVVDLERRQTQLFRQIRCEYQYIKHAPPTIRKQYDDLAKEVKNMKKNLRDEINKAYRKDYFYRAHNRVLERQLDKTVVNEGDKVELVVQHQLEERIQVQKVLCDLSTDLSAIDIVSRKIHAIDLLVKLASRQELLTRKPRASAKKHTPIKVESPSPDPFPQTSDFPLACRKSQCIFCLGREQLPYEQRIRSFAKVSHMMDHVERVHMRRPVESISCEHPLCKLDPPVLGSIMDFKSHVARVHGIKLRPRESDAVMF